MLLSKQPVAVRCLGDTVIVSFGNVTKNLPFEVALRASQLLRARAGDAKRSSGDDGRRWGVSGTLHNATPRRRELRERVLNVNKDLLRASAVDVQSKGALVVLKLGTTTVEIPYRAAFTISQWIRLRAKQAQRIAGDTRHWSTVAPAVH